MTMKLNPWQGTLVIVAFLASLTTLAVVGKDTAALVAVGMGILGGLGLAIGQGQGTRDSVNGNTTRMLQMMENMAEKLAASHPPPDDVRAVSAPPAATPSPVALVRPPDYPPR